jgi:hypothetical protein
MSEFRSVPDMKLTEQRKTILGQLVTRYNVTASEFYSLLGAATENQQRGVRRLLRDFTTSGLIARDQLFDRVEVQLGERITHWQYIYWLTPEGLDTARDLGLDPKRLGKAYNNDRSPLMLPHEHELAAFRSTLEAAVGRLSWRQSELSHYFRGAQSFIDPDALCFVGRNYFFVELERAKKAYFHPRGGPLSKAHTYIAYADPTHKAYQAKWPGMGSFLVLFVMKNAERRDNLLYGPWTRRGDGARVRDRSRSLAGLATPALFRGAALEDCRRDVLGRIWMSPDGAAHSLLD